MRFIPDSAIRQSYLWPCNAAMAAFQLSESWDLKITAHELKLRWEAELSGNSWLRELGERPEFGFTQDDKVKLARGLVAA